MLAEMLASRAPVVVKGALATGALLALAASVIRAGASGPAGAAGSPAAAALTVAQPGVAATAAAVAGLNGQVTAPAVASVRSAAATGTACRVRYSVTAATADRFTASLVLTNTGTAPLQNWTLRWAYPERVRITQGWNADVLVDAQGPLARDLGSGRMVQPGASTTIGFVATFTGAAVPTPVPSSFALNGVKCR